MFKRQQLIIAICVAILIALISFLLIPYLITQKSWGWDYNQKTALIGETIGGIIAPIIGFVVAILTFLAFYIQYRANQIQIKALKKQKKATKKSNRQNNIQQIENIFFELLKIHRENVKEMSYRHNEGRNVIVKILDEFYELIEIVQNSNIIRKNRLDEQDLANVSYLILFFGVEESVQETLENRFFQHYPDITDEILDIVKNLRGKHSPISQHKYYFNGHQSRLGHYYRHFFRTVNYIHENEILTDFEKEKYIKLLQTQLSTHEQVLFFFNSISDLGLPWELGSNVLQQNKLITKYHLIRNVPLGFMYGYNPKRYYPFLKLENDFEIRL